ncbi:MAG: hypothetical protein WDN06_14250 [Asticcacaulis sp.]
MTSLAFTFRHPASGSGQFGGSASQHAIGTGLIGGVRRPRSWPSSSCRCSSCWCSVLFRHDNLPQDIEERQGRS